MKIKPFFDNVFKGVKFDKKLAKKIRLYRVSFLTQTRDHVSFFGGSLLGTTIVRFKSNYVRSFFMDIINIEPEDIARELHNVPEVNPKFKISGDVFNLCLFYMAHRFLKDKNVEAAKECVLIFNYRTIAALISKRFRFQADMEIAIATHESLSNKFILKQKKSWVNFLSYRADKLIDVESPYRKNLTSLADDHLFINTINEGNSAIRSSFNIIYDRFITIRDTGQYVRANSIIDTMNEEEVGEIADRLVKDLRVVLADVKVISTFLNKDVLTVLKPIIPDYAVSNIEKYIRGLSEAANVPKTAPMVTAIVKDTVTFCYDKVAKATMTKRERNSPAAIVHIAKGALYTTRVIDPVLLKLKKDAETMVNTIKPIHSNQRNTAVKHAMLLYIFIYSMILR